MEAVRNPPLSALASSSQRVLLINAPAVDVRLPWARWQQPVGLLQVGTALRDRGCDVRFVACLHAPASGRLQRERVERLRVEGTTLDIWRFGLSPNKVAAQLRQWRQEGWRPDRVLVSVGVGTWWQGVRDVVAAVKKVVGAPVILGGPYVTYYTAHAAAQSGADVLVVGNVPEARGTIADLSLYRPSAVPRFAGICLLQPADAPATVPAARSPEDLAAEVSTKAALGVTTFAFYDDWLGQEHRESLSDALRAICALDLSKAGFVAVGNFSPKLIDEELATLLRQARFRQVYLHDDVTYSTSGVQHTATEDDYARCVRCLHAAGFRPRTDEVGAGVLVGFPGEDVSAVAGRLVRLASIVGSVNLVPFQYTPGTPGALAFGEWLAQRDGHIAPTTLNAQLFPLARLAGASLEDYRELTRLAALLNAKYRSRTFDFLGSSLTAKMVRQSINEETWDPFKGKHSGTVALRAGSGGTT